MVRLTLVKVAKDQNGVHAMGYIRFYVPKFGNQRL